jgi:hypothetical protein
MLLYFSEGDFRNGRRVEEKQGGDEARFIWRWEGKNFNLLRDSQLSPAHPSNNSGTKEKTVATSN